MILVLFDLTHLILSPPSWNDHFPLLLRSLLLISPASTTSLWLPLLYNLYGLILSLKILVLVRIPFLFSKQIYKYMQFQIFFPCICSLDNLSTLETSLIQLLVHVCIFSSILCFKPYIWLGTENYLSADGP